MHTGVGGSLEQARRAAEGPTKLPGMSVSQGPPDHLGVTGDAGGGLRRQGGAVPKPHPLGSVSVTAFRHLHCELNLPSTPWLLKQMNSLHMDKS